MKSAIKKTIESAIRALATAGKLPADQVIDIQLERCRDEQHGHFASNIALILAKSAGQSPRALAQLIVDHFPPCELIQKVDIAGPGFINFFLVDDALLSIIPAVLNAGDHFGCSDEGKGQRIHIEYVSANPTGPLHVGHGRSAAYGACVSNLLAAIGYDVHREYYVNDAGRQMRILALSVWLRYLELLGEAMVLPENGYQGGYIIDIAAALKAAHGDQYRQSYGDFIAKVSKEIDNEDRRVDAMIDVMQALIGTDAFDIFRQAALESILADIKADLVEFGVIYQQWFRESQLFKNKLLDDGIGLLKSQGHVFERSGALWFRATDFGDEKDRVLLRANGQPTYFASDVAYHLYKYQQGYDRIIDVFGADHHGYIPRIKAFLKGLKKDPGKLDILLVQFAILYRGDEKVSMSTRSGEFVTLRELREEVGNDAARYFYIMRKPEQHLDFDLELAKAQNNDNPVYYIQYAHARICSVWRQLESAGLAWDQDNGLANTQQLNHDAEKLLLVALSKYAELIVSAAKQYEPHLLANYLQGLANLFHGYYNACRFIIDEVALRDARLCLVATVQQVLKNGLGLLGLSAPESM